MCSDNAKLEELLEQLLHDDKLIIHKYCHDYMSPTIPVNSLLLLEKSSEFTGNDIYLTRIDGKNNVSGLEFVAGNYLLIYPNLKPIKVCPSKVEILGKLEFAVTHDENHRCFLTNFHEEVEELTPAEIILDDLAHNRLNLSTLFPDRQIPATVSEDLRKKNNLDLQKLHSVIDVVIEEFSKEENHECRQVFVDKISLLDTTAPQQLEEELCSELSQINLQEINLLCDQVLQEYDSLLLADTCCKASWDTNSELSACITKSELDHSELFNSNLADNLAPAHPCADLINQLLSGIDDECCQRLLNATVNQADYLAQVTNHNSTDLLASSTLNKQVKLQNLDKPQRDSHCQSLINNLFNFDEDSEEDERLKLLETLISKTKLNSHLNLR